MSSPCGASSSCEDKYDSTYQIIMVRHGESESIAGDYFCGWLNVQLTEKGKKQARKAGKLLKKTGLKFDCAHTSRLSRAQDTLSLILKEMKLENVSVCSNWRLNEVHCGAITGLSRPVVEAKYGEDQVNKWRRAFTGHPEAMTEKHPCHAMIVTDPRYADAPDFKTFPAVESAKMAQKRILPYWKKVIVPQLKSGCKLIIVAHFTVLRVIALYLEKMPLDQYMELEVPNAVPFIYELDRNFLPIQSMAAAIKDGLDPILNKGQ